MPGFVIDRREEHKDKSPTSRDRFIKRYKDIIKKAAADTVQNAKGFQDLTTGKEGQEHKITIARKTLDEPQFVHGKGGDHEFILSGNDRWNVGDTLPKPQEGGGGGREGSPDGEGEDDFTFYLNREEFLRLILDDLALPDLIKKNLLYSVISEYAHAGFTKYGSPGNMDVSRSYKCSLSRRIGLHRGAKKFHLAELEEKLLYLLNTNADQDEIDPIETEIALLRAKLKTMPFFDPNIDLRYRHRELEKKPSVSAIMFCVMDVSGSMTESLKMNAKYFFMLLHLFLRKNYTNVAVVFVRHTSVAEEVDEETFFYDRETGGTIVSSALDLVYDIIKERYDPLVWNIYIAQASDGDNYSSDSARCQFLLESKLLLLAQYMVYVEMSDRNLSHYQQHGASIDSNSDLWKTYARVADHFENLHMKTIADKKEIYPVFRRLFEKKLEHV